MPKRFRLTRRFAAAMTEDGYRGLRRFADDTGLDHNEALTFVFEQLGHITDEQALQAKLRRFRATLADRKT